jgi:hypothetical protein
MTTQMKHLTPTACSFLVFAVGVLLGKTAPLLGSPGGFFLAVGGVGVCMMAVIFLLYYVTFCLLDRFFP